MVDICLGCIFSGLTAMSTYFLTKELWNAGAGLFAACFIAIGKYSSSTGSWAVPGVLQALNTSMKRFFLAKHLIICW